MTEYEFHPLANVFPLLEGGEFNAMIEDIKAQGLNEPIVLYEGKILEGRNRYRACIAAGIEPRYREMVFDSYDAAKAYVISANIHRRHLTAEQRAELIVELLKANPEKSNLAIAKEAGRSDKTVDKIRRQLEANSKIPNKTGRVEASGRKARGRKPGSKSPSGSKPTKPEAPPAEPQGAGEPTGMSSVKAMLRNTNAALAQTTPADQEGADDVVEQHRLKMENIALRDELDVLKTELTNERWRNIELRNECDALKARLAEFEKSSATEGAVKT